MADARLPPSIVNRVVRELRDLQTRPEEGIRVSINEENLGDIQAEYDGPEGTPFEGGVFRMRLVLGGDFPNAPPKGYFFTKIFHPNVAKSGDICVNVLKADWKSSLPLRHIFVVIRCLLVEPFPQSALNEEAGKLLLEDYEDYARHARLMTSIHARPAKRSTPLTSIGGGNVVNTQGEEGGPEVKKPKGTGEAPKGGAAGGAPDPAKAKAAAAAAARKRGLKRL